MYGVFSIRVGIETESDLKKRTVANEIVKLPSNLQTQLNFSWFELELTLFSHGMKEEEEEELTHT